MDYRKTLVHSLLPAIAATAPVYAQSVEGDVHLDFTEVPIYDDLGELADSDLVYQGATANLQINLPIVQAISVRGSALDGPVYWGDTSTWDNPTLALGRAFPITYAVANPLFGKPVSPTGVVQAIDALVNGGPTEMTIGIPVKIAVIELPGLEIDFNPGAELKWNVNLPSSADVIMNQAARVENISIFSGAGLTGNTNMIVREDVFNGGLFTNAAGLVEGDFVNSGADSAGDRTVLTGGVLTVGGIFSNQSGAGVYGHGRIEGAVNNAGHITANTGALTVRSDSLAGSGTLGASTGGTLVLQNTEGSSFSIAQDVVLSGGTLNTAHGFTTSGSSAVRGYGEIDSDVSGHVIAEGGTLQVRESDSFESGALLEAASGGTLEWRATNNSSVYGNRHGSTMRALDGGVVVVKPFESFFHDYYNFTNEGVIEVMGGGELRVLERSIIDGGGRVVVRNAGLLTTGANTYFNQLIENEGALDLGSGTKLRGGLMGQGFDVAAGRHIYLDMADESAFQLSSVVTLSGGLLVAEHGFTTSGSGVVRGHGQLNGDIGGHVIAEGGTLQVRESDSFELGALLEAASGGTLEWRAVNNSNTYGNRPGSTMRALDGGVIVVKPLESFFHDYYDLTNEGMIEVMGGGVLRVLEQARIEGGGDIVVREGGVLQLDQESQIIGATLSGGGTFDVSGGILRDVVVTEGITIGDANLAGSLAIDGVVSASSYTVTSLSSLQGSGTITADVVNRGLVAPGSSPGMLTIDGDYSHRSGAELLIEIGGTSSGAFDVLNVLGDVTLEGGTLRVVFTDDEFFVPTGTEYDLFTANSITGDFDSVVLPTNELGATLLSIDLDQDGVVSITALTDFQVVPEPASLMFFGIAGFTLLIHRRRAA